MFQAAAVHPSIAKACIRIELVFRLGKLNLAPIKQHHHQINCQAPMSRRSVRLTPFTRFFLLMLIVAPLAYMGAAYYNGEDGWAKLKQMVGLEQSQSNTEADTGTKELPPATTGTPDEELARLKKLINEQEMKIKDLMKENQELRARIEALDKELNPDAQ